MSPFVYIILFAFIVLISMVIYDNRHSILSFFKEKFYKPKEFKVPKVREKTKPKEDPDEAPSKDKMNYGEFNPNTSQSSETTTFTMDNIFEQDDEKQEDSIDVDKMYEDLRREEAKKLEHHYKSDDMDADLPDFDNMSIDDLDDFLQNNFDDGDRSKISSYEGLKDEMSGEELGRAIKTLPRPLKILIASDILKRKDW